MRRPPRPPRTPVVQLGNALRAALGGLALGLATLGVVALGRGDRSDDAARSLGFITLVVGNLALILANRSLDRWMLREIFVPSRAFAVLATATLGLLAICVLVPFARSLFAFEHQKGRALSEREAASPQIEGFARFAVDRAECVETGEGK